MKRVLGLLGVYLLHGLLLYCLYNEVEGWTSIIVGIYWVVAVLGGIIVGLVIKNYSEVMAEVLKKDELPKKKWLPPFGIRFGVSLVISGSLMYCGFIALGVLYIVMGIVLEIFHISYWGDIEQERIRRLKGKG